MIHSIHSRRGRLPLGTLLASTLLAGLAAPLLAMNPTNEKYENRPVFQSIDTVGVELFSGLFVHKDQDLSIGPGEEGLSFVRYYAPPAARYETPNLQTHPFSVHWTHNLDFRAVGTYDAKEDQSIEQTFGDAVISVMFNTQILQFRQGPAARQNGSLAFEPDVAGTSIVVGTNGDTMSVTAPDGTVAELERMGHDCGTKNTVKMYCAYGTSITSPDGERLTFEWQSVSTSPVVKRLKSVRSNRGLAIVFDYATATSLEAAKSCSVNLAAHYLAPLADCPAAVQTATYNGYNATKPGGVTSQYSFGPFEFERVGVAGKEVVSFDTKSRVTSIQFGVINGVATGGTRTYAYSTANVASDGQHYGNYQTTVTEADGGQTIYYFKNAIINGARHVEPLIEWKQDPLGNKTFYEYGAFSKVSKETRPEGDYTVFAYDSRGNRTSETRYPKPGSSLAAIGTSATFASSCSNAKTCNKPLSVTDAKGNVTDFTYDTNHGGVLTETGPAVNGVRAQKRYSYAQKYAYVKNSAGTLVQAATPVWVLTQISECISGAASGAGCASPADEVKTVFEYGATGTALALLQRGTVVDSGGLSLRSCVTYDSQQNVIAKTAPKAGLSTC